ncbi:MAG: hypothetical protein C4557_01200 [Anaerolineaceae bacterium]|nr:MAG: hypothetical protein C4557_01200 [Anaerolineaceae bacterium]
MISEDQLVSELWARDVPFLMGEQTNPEPLLDPATLIQSLAQSNEARIRMALIPLFLRHPEFSSEVIRADERLSPAEQLYLRFYYTATVLLQKKYQERLMKVIGGQIQLPDLFSEKLGITLDTDLDEALIRLGKRHQVLSGRIINWVETYEHSAERFVKYVEKFG